MKNRAAIVTATVGYAGVAPSNFGSALGYDAVTVDASATSFTPLADFRSFRRPLTPFHLARDSVWRQSQVPL